MNFRTKKMIVAISAIFAATTSYAQTDNELVIALPKLEEMLVTGGEDNIRTLSGSAHLLDEESLEQFDFSDLNQVLGTLPGVYIRQEDGYGLRPNIGLRGVTSDRSQKITLMEDGVLIKPAPYSAPAAYYIPNISRMSAIEVVKGPASIKQGPNNVGGAINLATQPIPADEEGFVDITAGSDGYEKYQVFYGDTVDNFGYWIDALHYGSDGFKDLDSGGDTGFERNDINAKLQWSFDDLFGYQQLITVKLGYADEEADETYLGLTEEDFNANPHRRYAASQLALFESEHEQLHLDHIIVFSDELTLNTKAYWNSFERSWNKLDGFIDGIALDELFEDPDRNASSIRAIGILKGEINSTPGDDQDTLDVTNNDREYGSYGIQFKTTYTFTQGDFNHEIESGIRFHHDYIERDHFTRSYLMADGIMESDGIFRGNKTLNEAESDAIAIYINDTVTWKDWTFNAGLRYEDIESESTNFLNNTSDDKSQSVFAPGAGAFWQFTDQLGFLVGINKGFSPAGASSGDDADPEEAINYEYGLRYNNENTRVELIGFFSDYDNLLGRCRVSDSGCTAGEEFNGDNVEIAGFELFGEFMLPAKGNLQFPLNINYTYTESAFQSSFTSSFSQWGDVIEGDELPYLPEHVGRIQLGVRALQWDAYIAVSYQSEMRNEAGRENMNSVLHTDSYTTVDFSASWQATPDWMLQLSVDNVTDEEAIVSWRPFGARPNKPRSFRARVKYSF